MFNGGVTSRFLEDISNEMFEIDSPEKKKLKNDGWKTIFLFSMVPNFRWRIRYFLGSDLGHRESGTLCSFGGELSDWSSLGW